MKFRFICFQKSKNRNFLKPHGHIYYDLEGAIGFALATSFALRGDYRGIRLCVAAATSINLIATSLAPVYDAVPGSATGYRTVIYSANILIFYDSTKTVR